MVGVSTIPGLLPVQYPGGRVRLAQPCAGSWGSSGRAGGNNRHSHHAGRPARIADVARVVSGCDLPGQDLGRGFPWANGSEISRHDEARVAAGITGGPRYPNHHWLHSLSRRSDPPGRGLLGVGSVCLAALPGFTSNNGLKTSVRFWPRGSTCASLARSRKVAIDYDWIVPTRKLI